MDSGLQITQGGGTPGDDGAEIRIRGLGTFSGAGNQPLVLVDGFASSIDNVDPNDIDGPNYFCDEDWIPHGAGLISLMINLAKSN